MFPFRFGLVVGVWLVQQIMLLALCDILNGRLLPFLLLLPFLSYLSAMPGVVKIGGEAWGQKIKLMLRTKEFLKNQFCGR